MIRWLWKQEARPAINPRLLELETAEEILAEVFRARPSYVEEMIQMRLEEFHGLPAKFLEQHDFDETDLFCEWSVKNMMEELAQEDMAEMTRYWYERAVDGQKKDCPDGRAGPMGNHMP